MNFFIYIANYFYKTVIVKNNIGPGCPNDGRGKGGLFLLPQKNIIFGKAGGFIGC